MPNKKVQAIIGMIIANVCWGFSFMATKYVLTSIPPMTLAFLRNTISVPLLLIYLRKKEPTTRLQRRDIAKMAVSGLVGIALYSVFEFSGMQYLASSTASLLISSIPAITLLVDFVILRMRVSRLQWIGVALSILGVYIITRAASGGSNALIGIVLILLACISWVVYVIISRSLHNQYSGVGIATYQTFFGWIALAPLALTERARWQPISINVWIVTLLLAVICTTICYVLYTQALLQLGAIGASAFINISPIVAVVAGALFLNEKITFMHIIGGVIIILSLFAVSFSPKPTDSAEGLTPRAEPEE